MYPFEDAGKRKYNIKLWKTFSDVFNVMPVAALIDEKIFCMHGGISPQLESFEQILKLVRPLEVPDQGLLCDLLWADPEKGMSGWAENERGVSFIFGGDVVSNFLKEHDIDLICRAHQVVEEGYEFFAKRQLVTIFSAPNYCDFTGNSAAYIRINGREMVPRYTQFKAVVISPSRSRTPQSDPWPTQASSAACSDPDMYTAIHRHTN